MNRKECEKKIIDLMIQIDEVYHEYNPDGKYLSLAIVDGAIMADNGTHDEKQLDVFRVIKRNGKIHEA